MKRRWTIKELTTLSDEEVLAGILTERLSTLNGYAPLAKRLVSIRAALDKKIVANQVTKAPTIGRHGKAIASVCGGIPKTWPVQPLKIGETAKSKATCGTCNRSWDDGKVTSITPAPSARCPFEKFHNS